MSPKSIVDLIQLIATESDEASFRTFYNNFFPRLLELAQYYTKSNVLAEEVVSDVFVKIWLHRKRLMNIGNIQGYLYIAVKNQSFDTLKKQKQNMLYIDHVEHELIATCASPDQSLYTEEFLSFFSKSVEALPDKVRLVFKLIKQDGLKYKEAADTLNLSAKSIEMYMSAALKQLRKSIRHYHQNEGKHEA